MSRRMRGLPAAMAAFALILGSSFGAAVSTASAADSNTSSSLTKQGSGDFSGLTVSVSQTRNLLDQVVRIGWSGVEPTRPAGGLFGVNYVQIMQCWGDDPSGPSREQCAFGGLTGDNRGGGQVPTRQVNYDTVVDPLETIKQEPGSFKNVFVPFRSVSGKVEEGSVSEFYDATSTNEVPFGLNRPNGTGQDFFNVQSVRENSGLGCGEPITKNGKTTPRNCWLVVVPRNNKEVDGTVRSGTGVSQLVSSPLSASNWKNRIVFPLEFEPVGRPCPLGKAERKTLGQESAAEAVTRWQPALCADGGPVFSYAQVSDDVSRRELKTDDPGLAFLSKPLSAADLPDGRTAVYAPMAISGITVGFNVESQSFRSSSPEIKERDGTRLTQMNLTPRLVAKLITQSYTKGADVDAPSVQGNPTDMSVDPEFLAINPNYVGLRLSMPEALLPLGRADVHELVWRWLLADPEAKSFLQGKPDPWNMKLNSNYRDLTLPRPDYPKAETFCRTRTDAGPHCTLDTHPYSASFSESAKAAARGDTLARTVWDSNATPPVWKKDKPQPSGKRSVLAVIDTASAGRYGLETASIKNPAGAFIAPTRDSMTAAALGMKPGANPTVLEPDLRTKNPKAYPLTSLTYGATVPQVLDNQAKQQYSAFLTYAATKGQEPGVEPGKLPFGYAPLTASLAKQTQAVATALKTPTTTDDEAIANGGGTGSPSDGSGDQPTATSGAGAAPTDAGASPGTVDSPGAGGDGANVNTVALTTPLDSAGAGRLVPAAALILGLMAAAAGPLLLRYSTRV